MKLSETGILPNWEIGNLHLKEKIKQHFKKDLRLEAALIELTYAGANPLEVKPGESATLLANEILDLPNGIIPVGDGKSSVAKTDSSIKVAGFGNYALEPGYSGELQVEINPYKNRVRILPGEPLANMRFYRGCPQDCILDPKKLLEAGTEDVMNNSANIYFDEDYGDPEIAGNKVRLTLNLSDGGDSGIVGYRAKETDKVIRLVKHGNLLEDFFEPIYQCDEYSLNEGDFVLLKTNEKIFINPYGKIPFVGNMPSINMDGLKVNHAEYLCYGSGPHAPVMEIHAESGLQLGHGDYICEVTFSSICGKPLKMSYHANGNLNNKTIAGTFFYQEVA